MIDRKKYEGWVEAGSLTMGERLNQQVKKILQEHTPEPLPDGQVRAIREIVERAERRSAEGDV